MDKKRFDELVGSVKEAGKIKRGQKKASRTTKIRSLASASKPSKTPLRSQTDWPRLRRMRDQDIDTSDIPELTAEAAAGGVVRRGGKVVARGKKRPTTEPAVKARSDEK